MNTINVENCKTLLIGRRGENEVTTVAFDFTEWASEFGSGVVDLYVKRFGDESAYPVVLTIDGTVASWLVTETDTNVAGYGKAEYVYRVDGKIAKSAVFPFFVAEDIGQPASEPPDPYESWLEQLTALGAETEANAQAAEQSAEDAAESAEDAAQRATSAEGYAGQAETAAGLAQDAQTASEAARDAAQAAQASAEASATAASGSAASAAGSATAAAGSASDASASASSAGASATTASNAATAAQTAQSAAEDAAEDAQQAAQQAHVEYEQLSGEVDDLSDEVSQQKSAIEDLQDLVDRKAGMLVDTASGSIASFVPDATIDNLLGVSVDIEPVQDLHGYDAPWPAGGNVNLLPCTATPGTQTINGVTWNLHEDGSISISGTATEASTFRYTTDTTGFGPYFSGDYKFYAFPSNIPIAAFQGGVKINARWYSVYAYGDTNISGADGQITEAWFQVRLGKTLNTTIYPMIYPADAQTPTSWTPYSNICPISGWDAVEVEATGINIWDEEWELGGLVNATGLPFNATDRFRSKNFCACKPGVTYFGVSPTNYLGIYWYDRDFAYIGYQGAANLEITAPLNAYHFKIVLANGATTYNHDISINYPSTDHAYHPYAGNRYTIQLGQTVYGAKLTIAEDGSVNALVDTVKAIADGTITPTASTTHSAQFLRRFPEAAGYTLDATALKCNRLKPSSYSSENNNLIFFSNSLIVVMRVSEEVTDWVSWFRDNPVEFSYKIANPVTIQLDPVTISTISGQTNNVWADAGDVSVRFAADLKAYIDRLNQPIEDDMIANSLIAANKYFTINNRLFLSTASIAAGAQIIPGHNCTETNLAAALNALNA